VIDEFNAWYSSNHKTLADAKKLKKDFLDKGNVDGYKIIDVIIE
jgi:hypothetical protein